MLYVYTFFDTRCGYKPLISSIYDSNTKSIKLFKFYVKGTGKSLYDIDIDIEYFKNILDNDDCIIINDFKHHVMAFGFDDPNKFYEINMPQSNFKLIDKSIDVYLTLLRKILPKIVKIKPLPWHNLMAKMSTVHAYLENRGYLYGYVKKYPIWGKTFTGRSKSSGFNVQGLSDDLLHNINGDDIFINIDWVAADFRAMAVMSGDKSLDESFINGDPYLYLANYFNSMVAETSNELTRYECKQLLLHSTYSLDIYEPIKDVYGGLCDWMRQCQDRLDANKSLQTILGRKFRVSNDRGKKSVFNATIQGSVAHAMHNVAYQIYKLYPDNLLLENHDSVVMTCTVDSINNIVRDVARIMIRPFYGILHNDYQFPIEISIGKKYRCWRHYKRFDNYEQIR